MVSFFFFYVVFGSFSARIKRTLTDYGPLTSVGKLTKKIESIIDGLMILDLCLFSNEPGTIILLIYWKESIRAEDSYLNT